MIHFKLLIARGKQNKIRDKDSGSLNYDLMEARERLFFVAPSSRALDAISINSIFLPNLHGDWLRTPWNRSQEYWNRNSYYELWKKRGQEIRPLYRAG